MAGQRSETTTVEGMVDNANDTGLRVNGQWYDYSRYAADVRKDTPKGARVRLEIQRERFIQKLTRLDLPASEHETAGAAPRYDGGSSLTPAQEIRRQALVCAIEYLLNRPPLPDDQPLRANLVLECAARFSTWIETGGTRLQRLEVVEPAVKTMT